LRNNAWRLALAVLASGATLQPLAMAAEPATRFICTPEHVAYHMHFSETERWEIKIETDNSDFIIANDANKKPGWFVYDDQINRSDIPYPLYQCDSSGTVSSLSCKGTSAYESDDFKFSFITQKFQRFTQNPDWVTENGSIAMIYQYGKCRKK